MRLVTHRRPRSLAILATIAIAALATIGAAGTVGAGVDQVCPDLDTGHIDGNNQTSITITAPPGKVIVQVCVKAGSAEQGDGPEITNFNPGVTSTTISHSSGKEISHYSVKYADAPPPPPEQPPEQPPTEVTPTPPAPGAPAAAAVTARPVFTG